jgi:hypothetical protein
MSREKSIFVEGPLAAEDRLPEGNIQTPPLSHTDGSPG